MMKARRLSVLIIAFAMVFAMQIKVQNTKAIAGTTAVSGVTVLVDKFETRFIQLDGSTTVPFKRVHGTIFNLNNFDIQIDSVTLNFYSGTTLVGSATQASPYINWIYGLDFIPNATRIPAYSETSLGLYPSVSSSIWQNSTDVKVSLSWHQISYDQNRNFELTVVSTNTSSESRGGTNATYQTHVVRVKNLNSGAARQPEIAGIYRASSNHYGLFSAIAYYDTFNYFNNLGGWTDTANLMAPGETRELVLKRQMGLDEPEVPTNVTFIAESITPLAAANPVVSPPVTSSTPVAPTNPSVPNEIFSISPKKKFTVKSLAKLSGVIPASPKAKVSFKVSKASKKVCTKSGSKLKTLKPGNCILTFTVQEPKPKKGKKPKATQSVKTFAVQ